MNIVRRVFLRYALSRDPKVVEKSLGKLEGLLKATGGGENFHAYSEAVEAYRDVAYFLSKVLGAEAHKVEKEAPILTMMSKNPFIPGKVVEIAGEDAFKDAVEEVSALKALYEKAKTPAK